MKVYKIAGMNIGISHNNNPLLSARLKDYQTNETAKFFLHSLVVDEIVLTDAVKVQPLMYVGEVSGYNIIYTLNKEGKVISKASISKDFKIVNIELSKSLGNKLEMMEYIASGLYFFEIAISEGLFPLHASAISYNGQAILFSAPSGVGKSTLAINWTKAYDGVDFINDDKPLISCNDEILVYGTPWCGKDIKHSNTVYPLKAIIFINQAKSNYVRELANAEKMIHLFKNTHRSQYKENQDKLVKNIDLLINKAKVISYFNTPEIKAAYYLKNYLYGEE